MSLKPIPRCPYFLQEPLRLGWILAFMDPARFKSDASKERAAELFSMARKANWKDMKLTGHPPTNMFIMKGKASQDLSDAQIREKFRKLCKDFNIQEEEYDFNKNLCRNANGICTYDVCNFSHSLVRLNIAPSSIDAINPTTELYHITPTRLTPDHPHFKQLFSRFHLMITKTCVYCESKEEQRNILVSIGEVLQLYPCKGFKFPTSIVDKNFTIDTVLQYIKDNWDSIGWDSNNPIFKAYEFVNEIMKMYHNETRHKKCINRISGCPAQLKNKCIFSHSPLGMNHNNPEGDTYDETRDEDFLLTLYDTTTPFGLCSDETSEIKLRAYASFSCILDALENRNDGDPSYYQPSKCLESLIVEYINWIYELMNGAN